MPMKQPNYLERKCDKTQEQGEKEKKNERNRKIKETQLFFIYFFRVAGAKMIRM